MTFLARPSSSYRNESTPSSRSTPRVPLSSSIIFASGGVIVPDDNPVGTSAADLSHGSEETSTTLIGDSNSEGGQIKRAPNGESSGEDEVNHVGQDEEEMQERKEMMSRPFYRRPSPWWMQGAILLMATSISITLAPKVELYTKLACQAIKPEYVVEDFVDLQHWGTRGTVTPPSKMCGKDPEVQAAVAGLVTIMTVSSGILSCLTTGWWGQLSDRYGRTRILGIATLGILVTDFNFILVSRAANRLPGGYRFLMVGSAVNGILGGIFTFLAGVQAYISDCTSAGERSRMFSLNGGLLYGGTALGPTLGGLLIRVTNDLLSVFYLAAASHLVYGVFIWFIIPESLPKSFMRRARKRRAEHSENAAASDMPSEQDGFAIRVRITSFVKSLFPFLAPLSIFLPSKQLKIQRRDWSLVIMVLSFAFYGLPMGLNEFKVQYAQHAFGWNSEDLGYWLSVVSISRATYLVLILPLIIKHFKPKPAPIQLPVSPSEPLNSTQSESSSGPHLSASRLAEHLLDRNTASFDLKLARVSLGTELVCYAGMALSMSPVTWTVASMLTSLGGGFSPASQSVALALYEQGPHRGLETGRLFGGLSVVQTLSTQILGPSIFGFTYISTVNIFPKAIFVVAGGAVACALFFMAFVRLARGPLKAGHDREETLVVREGE